MQEKIIIYMVIKNVSKKQKLFENVVNQASKISKDFFIVNHGSDDNTVQIIESLKNKNNLNIELINEKFVGTMDDMKGKYYKVLKNKYQIEKKYIFILDWDEVLDDKLVFEINNLDFKNDVYMINRHTYLINNVIDKKSYLPLLFEVNSVVVAPFEKFHKLYEIKSKNIKKLNGILHHYSYETINDLINKNIYYAKNEAIGLYEVNKQISNFVIFFKILFEGSLYFFYTLIYHQNFLTLEGWLYSINWYVYKFYKYLFYLELKKGKIY